MSSEPSQKALDYAARKAGFEGGYQEIHYCDGYTTHASIVAHASTLDELWAIKSPKTRGELFAEEANRRWNGAYRSYKDIVAEMIDEGWEPKA